MMGVAVAQTNGPQLSDWVPESILQSLMTSNRSSARLRLNPSRTTQYSPTRQQGAAGEIAPSAVQEEQRLFLADAANLPESLHATAGSSDANYGDVEAEMQRMARTVAGNQSNPSSKHTYGYKTGKPHLPSTRPPQREKLDNPVRSIRDQRERILGRLAMSKTASASGIAASVYEKDADYRRGGAQASLDVIFDPNIYVPPEEGKHGPSSPARQRQRPPVPVSSMPIYPNPTNSSKHAYATPNGDAIDEFLVNSNRNAALPIASGQRIVSDHRNNLPPEFNEISGGQVGTISSRGVYFPGLEASSAEERIGQFGGLIPTLYTMDTPPAQRRINVAPNRYNFHVISRETKVTGAGFRRYTNTSPPRSHKAQSRRGSPIPNETSEQHQIAQDHQAPTN